MTINKKECYIEMNKEANPKQNRLMTFGLFNGSRVFIIKDDVRNNMMIIGVGQKRIAFRKEELEGIEFKEL